MRFGVGLFALQNTATQPIHWVNAYRDLREDALLMEELGYEELWFSEHHFFYDGTCPSPLTAAASVLAVTKRLRVGTGILLAALYEPQRLARVSHDLNERSGGRLDLGVGLGFRDVEFDGHGVSKAQRLSRMLAALDALEEEEARGGARIWMGGTTTNAALRAGSRNHPMLFSALNPVRVCQELANAHRRGWEEAGRPGGSWPTVSAYRNIWLTEDPKEREAALDWVRASYVQYAGLGLALAPPGNAGEMDFVRDADNAIQVAVDSTITGSAGQIVLQLQALEKIGLRQVAFRLILDGAPRAAVESQLRRLATEILPRLMDSA